MGDVVKGEHREWARFILHNVNLKNFPLRRVAPGIEDERVFYGDRDRH